MYMHRCVHIHFCTCVYVSGCVQVGFCKCVHSVLVGRCVHAHADKREVCLCTQPCACAWSVKGLFALQSCWVYTFTIVEYTLLMSVPELTITPMMFWNDCTK